jgi:anaerobic magnesium-protoporphyrin IX monomethyl ester cyclase
VNILFVNPSLRNGSPSKYLPVGIASVMTYVESKGFSFDLLDVDIDDLSDEEVENALQKKDYNVILTGAIVTHYKWIKWFTRCARSIHPDACIVVGNSVASSIPYVFLENSEADIAIIGEGEETTYEVLRCLQENKAFDLVAGIVFKKDGEIIRNQKRKAKKHIDDFPMVQWKHFNVEKYFQKSYAGADGLVFDGDTKPRVMPVISARGCVFRCTFCHFVFSDDPYRFRKPKSIIDEIKRNISAYGANYINLWDDLTFGSLRQAENFVDNLLDEGISINWNASVRTDLFGNPKYSLQKRKTVAEKFRKSGCLNLGFSLESANEEILEMMEKRVSREYFGEQVKILKEVGITSGVSVVFGYPIETKETIRETFDMCLESGIYPSIGYLLPLPSTKMYDYALNNGFISDEDQYLDLITERQDLCINMTSLESEEILGAIKEGATELNNHLQLGLEEGSLVKTGSYRNHTQKTSKKTSDLKRGENELSLSYSTAVFENKLGNGEAQK